MSSSIQKLYSAFLQGAAICTDTRSIKPGSIFFALKGENFNGNKFAVQALESGAAFAVVDEPCGNDARLVLVEDVLHFLQEFALHHRNQLTIPVIGITGSNGKTTTKELLNKVLSEKFRTLCTKGNLNNHIGVPLTLLSINNSHELAIIEMGANHQKEIELLCKIARPSHVLITNVGKAHLEGFGGFEGVKKGKGEMYAFAKANNAWVFINDDNEHLNEMLGSYSKVLRYGTKESIDVTGKLLPQSTFVSLQWKSKKNTDWQTIDSNITGAYNFENILSAVTAGVFFEVNAPDINAAVSSYHPDNQRSQVIERGDRHIVVDAYNANPTSMEAALKNFNNNFSGKRAVMLGDMFELGETSAKEHQLIADLVASFNFDEVILVGPFFSATKGIKNVYHFENSSLAAAWIRENPLSGFNILVKGSRGSKMEVALEAIS